MCRIELASLSQAIYLTPTGVKQGSKGKVLTEISELVSQLPKGDRRKLRRQLQLNGKGGLAKTGTNAYVKT